MRRFFGYFKTPEYSIFKNNSEALTSFKQKIVLGHRCVDRILIYKKRLQETDKCK